jgi:hypothetical protein
MTRLTCGASAGAFVALVLVISAAPVAAQSDDEYDKIYPFLGNWDSRISMPDGQDRGNCGGRTDEFGVKLVNCSMPVGQLPLNARGDAWLKYVDIYQSPSTTECVGLSLPSALGSAGNISFSGSPGRVVINVSQFGERTVWMNGGGPTPRNGELFHHTGYSVGRFDGDDLVFETSRFTFDPDGMDDHVHMANSARMKFTERYQFIDEDNLRVIMTIDDPIFLTRPFTYSRLFSRAPARGGQAGGWNYCDPEASRREVEFNYPQGKYSTGEQR